MDGWINTHVKPKKRLLVEWLQVVAFARGGLVKRWGRLQAGN